MITDIVLENFKGFQKVEIQPKRITAFVGPNGTGKSSVLQAFGLLKQTVEDTTGKGIHLVNPLLPPFTLRGPLVNAESLTDLTASFVADEQERPSFYFKGKLKGSPFDYFTQFRESDRPAMDSNTTSVLTALISLKMAPAVRGLNQPKYDLGSEQVRDVFLKEGIAQREAQTVTNLCYSPEQVEQVSHLLKKVTGTGLRADTVPSKSVEVKSLNQAGSFNIVAEGFGTNSLIMLLMQLVSADPGATVMIEEPEIHLHPKAQADLAEVLAAEALAGDKQVIMTTHSEHILNRLLTLVVEDTLPLEDLAIYAFEKDEETGVCSAKPLKIDAGGRVEGGIKDFFDTNLAELKRYSQAQFARMPAAE